MKTRRRSRRAVVRGLSACMLSLVMVGAAMAAELPSKAEYSIGPGPSLPQTPIRVGLGQEFTLSLYANPTTQVQAGAVVGGGFCVWIPSYSKRMLELLDRRFEPIDPSRIERVNLGRRVYEGGTLAASGIEHFRFKALSPGQTRVIMVFTVQREEGSYTFEPVFPVSIEEK